MDLELKQFADTLGKLDTATQASFKSINERIDTLVTGGATKADIEAFKSQLNDSSEQSKKDIKAVNDFAIELQKQFAGKSLVDTKRQSFEDSLGEIIEKNAAQIQAGRGIKMPMEFDMKDFNAKNIVHKDMSFAGNTTGTVVPVDYDRNIYGQPFEIPHLRQFIRNGTTASNMYSYVRAKRKNDAIYGPKAGIAPGQLKPEQQYQFDQNTAPVIKIAGHVRLPEEMVDDIPGMTSYLQAYLPEDVLRVEDQEILRGDGTTGHFNGLWTQARTHTLTPGVLPTEEWDILADALAQQQNIWLPPTLGLINPISWMFLVTRKSTDGIYSHPTLIAGVPLAVAGLRLMPHPIMGENDYLIGDFNRAQILFRSGLTVRWYDQDQDNAVKNLITVVAEERAALAVYYPEAFIKGTFQTT